jgi:O-antigen/teichoic acid export membrane protein
MSHDATPSFEFNLMRQGLHSLRHGSLIFLGVLITLLLNLLLVFRLSAGHYGDYALIIRNASFIALILTLGFDVSANRYLSNYIVAERWHLAKGYTLLSLRVLLYNSAIYLILLTAAAVVMQWCRHIGVLSIPGLYPIVWLWLAILIAFLQLGMVMLRTVHKADAGFFWGSVAQYALLLMGVWFFVKPSEAPLQELYRTLDLTAISYGFCVVIMAIVIMRSLYVHIKRETHIKMRTKKWLRVSSSMMGYSVLSMMAPAVILNVVQLMPKIAESDVGVFALCATICGAFGLIPSMTVKGSVMAWMKPLYKTNQKAQLAKLIVYCNWFGIAFNILFVLVVYCFGHQLIKHLPLVYHHMYWPLVWIALSYIFDPSINATRSALMMMGQQNKVLMVRIAVIVMLIVFGVIGSYYAGILGASIALVVQQIIAGIMDAGLLKSMGYNSLLLPKA